MGALSEVVAVLILRDLINAWDVAKEARKPQHEEMFVPFNLPPLPQQEQQICQQAEAVVKATSSTHVPVML